MDFQKIMIKHIKTLSRYEMVKFIDEWLRYHGVCEKMYIERTGVYNPLNENSAHIGGKYVWQPMLTLHPNIVEVPLYVRVYQEPHHRSLADVLKNRH